MTLKAFCYKRDNMVNIRISEDKLEKLFYTSSYSTALSGLFVYDSIKLIKLWLLLHVRKVSNATLESFVNNNLQFQIIRKKMITMETYQLYILLLKKIKYLSFIFMVQILNSWFFMKSHKDLSLIFTILFSVDFEQCTQCRN